MSKKFYVLPFLLLIGFASMASAATQGRGGLYFGRKSLNHSDWGTLDTQPAFGVDLDVRNESWPVWITAGYVQSNDETTLITSFSPFTTTTIEGETSEYRLGVKKDFLPVKLLRLSVAGGPAFIRAKIGSESAPYSSDSDSSAGYWAGANAFLTLGYVIVGVGYQYSHADLDLLGRSIDAGGENVAFSVGIGW